VLQDKIDDMRRVKKSTPIKAKKMTIKNVKGNGKGSQS